MNSKSTSIKKNAFEGCTSLESIPSGLFDGVTDTADFMFAGTFANCTSLTKLPNGLFKNITGEPRGGMFRGTFAFCDKLSGYIPSDTFALLSADGYMESEEWIECMPWGLECSGGSGTDARAMDNMFVGTNLDTTCPAGTTQYITGFEDDWSGKVACVKSCSSGQVLVNDECVEFTPEFTITTTSDTSSFSFRISAAGTYYLD